MKNNYIQYARDLHVVSEKTKRDEAALMSYVMASESMPTKKSYAGIADEVFSYVRDTDFKTPELAELFRVIKRLHDRRKMADEVIDLSKVSDALFQERVEKTRKYRKTVTEKDLEEINTASIALVRSVDMHTVMELPYDWHALIKSVIAAARTRNAIEIMRNNSDEIALGDEKKLNEVIDGLVAVRDRRANEQNDPSDPVNDVIDTIGDICNNLAKTPEERAAESLDTPFPDLNKVIEPSRKGFWVIGARASGGKTSFSCDLARDSVKKGRNVAYFTMEMGKKEIIRRMLCAEAVLPGNIVLKQNPARDLTDEEYKDLYDAGDRLTKNKNLRVYEDCMDIDTIENQCRILHAQKHLDVVIVDYLQRLNDVQASGGNRYSVLCDITMRLKNLAMKYDILIYALSQFNRSKDNLDEDGYPTMACLRDSGSIEQDADGVLAIHRPPRNEEIVAANAGFEPCKLFVLKNRNGAVGRIDFMFDTDHFRFGCLKNTYQASMTDKKEDEADTEAVKQRELFDAKLDEYAAGNASVMDAIREAQEESARTGKAVEAKIGTPDSSQKKRRGRPPKNAAAVKDEPKTRKKRSFADLPKAVQEQIKEHEFQKTCDDLAKGGKE